MCLQPCINIISYLMYCESICLQVWIILSSSTGKIVDKQFSGKKVFRSKSGQTVSSKNSLKGHNAWNAYGIFDYAKKPLFEEITN